MATPVEHILRNARAKPLTNEEVNVGILRDGTISITHRRLLERYSTRISISLRKRQRKRPEAAKLVQ